MLHEATEPPSAVMVIVPESAPLSASFAGTDVGLTIRLGDGDGLGEGDLLGLGERLGVGDALGEVRTTITCTADELADADGLFDALADELVEITTCTGELLSIVIKRVGDWLGDVRAAVLVGDISFNAE